MTVATVLPNEQENWDAPIMPSEPIARMNGDDIVIPEDNPDMECDLS